MSAEAASRPSIHLRVSSDARLARLAGDGDRQAFALIFERYHQPLYRYCRSIVRDPDDASDALQSVMANALRALPGAHADVALRSWLFRIAHNEAVSILRRRRSHQELREDTAASLHGGPVAAVERREELTELVGALRELPSRQRGALVMRELNGLAYEEIGSALEISASAAKQTVYEARRTLHEHAEGRSMSCEPVRRSVSAGDRRLLRARRVRAHLRHCAECREFDSHVNVRRAKLAALFPPLDTSSASAVLSSVIGGKVTGGGLLGGLGGGGALAGSGPVTAAVAIAIIVSTGVTTIAIAERAPGKGPSSTAAAGRASPPPLERGARAPSAHAQTTEKRRDAARRSSARRRASGENRRGRANRRHGDGSSSGEDDAVRPVSPGSGSDRVGSISPNGSRPAGSSDGPSRSKLPAEVAAPSLPEVPRLPQAPVAVPNLPSVPTPAVQAPVDLPDVRVDLP